MLFHQLPPEFGYIMISPVFFNAQCIKATGFCIFQRLSVIVHRPHAPPWQGRRGRFRRRNGETYRLHYAIDLHTMTSGTFKITKGFFFSRQPDRIPAAVYGGKRRSLIWY
jgi:hypothetical protein